MPCEDDPEGEERFMNYRGFKQASRQCLGDSGLHLRRLTALFLLCYYVISVSCDGISYLLDLRVQGASGLDAGANVIVAGSAVFHGDISQNVRDMMGILDGSGEQD